MPVGAARSGLLSGNVGIPPNGVSRWEFEQDVTDLWDANDWTDNTSAGFSTTAQVGTYAKAFDGTDDYLENGDIITETGAFTLTAWVRPDSLDSTIYSTDEDNNAPRGFQFQILSDGEIAVFDGNSQRNTGNTISTGTYSFVAMAKDASDNLTIDVNGTRSDFSANFSDTTHPLWMGFRAPSQGQNYDGLIDDGRLFDKKLSATELDNLRTTGSI